MMNIGNSIPNPPIIIIPPIIPDPIPKKPKRMLIRNNEMKIMIPIFMITDFREPFNNDNSTLLRM